MFLDLFFRLFFRLLFGLLFGLLFDRICSFIFLRFCIIIEFHTIVQDYRLKL